MACFVIKTTTTPSATNRLLTSLQMPQTGKTFELYCWLHTTRIAGDLSWFSKVVTLRLFSAVTERRGIGTLYVMRVFYAGNFIATLLIGWVFFAVVAGLRNLQKSKTSGKLSLVVSFELQLVAINMTREGLICEKILNDNRNYYFFCQILVKMAKKFAPLAFSF